MLQILDINPVVIDFASRGVPLDVDAKTSLTAAAHVARRMRTVLLTLVAAFPILLLTGARSRSVTPHSLNSSRSPSTVAAGTARARAINGTTGSRCNDHQDDDHDHHHHNNRQDFRVHLALRSVFKTDFKLA